MLLVWVSFIVQLLLYALIKPVIPATDVTSLLFIFAHLVVVLFAITRYEKSTALLLCVGLFLRVITMLWDIYGRGVYELPHSGSDTEGYLDSGMAVAGNLQLISSDLYGGLYSKLLGVLFFLGPEDRMIGQYVNVLLGLTTIVLVIHLLSALNVDGQLKSGALWIMILFPSGIIFSSILLREAIIAFLLVASFFYCLKWYEDESSRYMIAAISILLMASLFHSGVIGVAVGYAFLFIFYQHQTKRLVFSPASIIPFSLAILAVLYVWIVSIENIPFLRKFAFYLDGEEDLFEMASGNMTEDAGGSAYLTGLQIHSVWDLLLYAPIKMFYFLSSPLPWGWRGLNDMISFTTDGILYCLLISYAFWKSKWASMDRPLWIGMVLMIVVTVFLFGIGVDNAGTSMRHRYKLLYLMILLAVPVLNHARKKG